MIRKPVLIIPALIVVLLLSVNCMAASALFTPTPTPTSTFTPTPTATPTLLPTFTITPTPDISSAELKLSDLPSGFTPLSPPANSDFPGMKWFEYGDPSPFQAILGAVTPLQQNDRFGFDATIKNPDLLLQSVNARNNQAPIKSLKPVSGLDKFGDMSGGYTGLTARNGIKFDVDIFLMRKGSVGVLVVSMYLHEQGPVISIGDLASILDKRASQFPVNTFSG